MKPLCGIEVMGRAFSPWFWLERFLGRCPRLGWKGPFALRCPCQSSYSLAGARCRLNKVAQCSQPLIQGDYRLIRL